MAGTNSDRDHSGLRRQRLLSDVDLIVRVCMADENNPFCSEHYVSVTPCISVSGWT